MTRLGRWLFVWAIWTGTVCGQLRGQHPVLVAADTVVTRGLDVLADTATVEHALCLHGRTWQRGGVLLVLIDSASPLPTMSDAAALRAVSGCPDGTVGAWHNHIFPVARTLLAQWYNIHIDAPIDACYFSRQDYEHGVWQQGQTTLEVVQVNRDVKCWWSADQLRHLTPSDYLRPPVGQLVPDPGDLPSHT